MYKKFEVNRTKFKGECQSETKVSQLISNRQLSLNTHMTSPILELSLVITALRRAVIFVLVSTSADREFNRTTAAKEGIGEEYSSNLGSILKRWMDI